MTKEKTINETTIFLTPNDVCSMLAISITTLWRLRHEENSTFPKSIRLTGKKVVFRYNEIKQWCDNQKYEAETQAL